MTNENLQARTNWDYQDHAYCESIAKRLWMAYSEKQILKESHATLSDLANKYELGTPVRTSLEVAVRDIWKKLDEKLAEINALWKETGKSTLVMAILEEMEAVNGKRIA